MKTIRELCIKHKCDKAVPEHHTYDEPYEFHFSKFRDKPIKLLEIGAGGYDNPNEGGCSLRMWDEYFTHPQRHIYSIDIYEKSKLQEDRITIWQGSQSDRWFLAEVIGKMGEVDIVIDDGSHVNLDVIASFMILFPILKMGGIYVVEDTQTSYWEHYGGGNEGSMEFFKSFIDGLNYKEIQTEYRGKDRPVKQPNIFDISITSIHFYHNMIFLYKGNNTVTA